MKILGWLSPRRTRILESEEEYYREMYKTERKFAADCRQLCREQIEENKKLKAEHERIRGNDCESLYKKTVRIEKLERELKDSINREFDLNLKLAELESRLTSA